MAGLWASLRYLRVKFLISFCRLLAKLFAPPANPKPDSVLSIPSRDKSRTIKAHLYKPGAGGPHPVLVNFCGSGLAIPGHGYDDRFCRAVATAAGLAVLDVAYRLGPEHPFPAATDDVEDAVRYVLGKPDEYDTSRVSVSGFSSGGTLALVAPTLFPRGVFRSVVAFYPATDLARDPGLRETPIPGTKKRSPFWTRIFREGYIREMDPRDPRISPAYADVSKYPAHLLIVTGELDTSALEAEALAERAKTEGQASGRDVVIRRMKRCGHGFDKNTKDVTLMEARDEAYGLAIDMLKKIASAGN